MATMNFSIPDDIKEAVNNTFAHANKSAVVAKLLLDAVEEARRRQESMDAARSIKSRWKDRPVVLEEKIREMREEGRS